MGLAVLKLSLQWHGRIAKWIQMATLTIIHQCANTNKQTCNKAQLVGTPKGEILVSPTYDLTGHLDDSPVVKEGHSWNDDNDITLEVPSELPHIVAPSELSNERVVPLRQNM